MMKTVRTSRITRLFAIIALLFMTRSVHSQQCDLAQEGAAHDSVAVYRGRVPSGHTFGP